MRILSRFHKPTPAPPVACPHCAATARLQVADLVQGVDVWRCRRCNHRWEAVTQHLHRPLLHRSGTGS